MAIRFASSAGGLLRGTSGKDVLWGAGGRDVIQGLGDADNIYGAGGDDRLDGGTGSDVIRGGSGSDVIIGGTGADVLTGDSGADFFLFRATETSTDTIRDFRVGEDQLVLGEGVFVDPSDSFRADLNLDGRTDTVLGLSNGATLVLLGVGGRQDWTLAGPNVMTASELDLLG